MRREAKAGLLAFALLGLLLVVALAARGGHPGSDGEVTPRPIPATAQDNFVTLLAVFYVVATVLVIVILFRHKGKWHEPEERHWLRDYTLVMVVLTAATLFGYYAITHGYLKRNDEKAPGAQQGQQTQRHRNATRSVPVRQAHFQWPLVVGIAGLVLLGGAAVYLRRRRDSSAPLGERTLEEDLADAVGATIEDLRNERDARRAVIAAYAQMEGVLAAHGLKRRAADAPLEYLTRILRELEVRESAVSTLTELFEYAKFSQHEIDGEMKERAIQALIAVRDDLQVEEAVAA